MFKKAQKDESGRWAAFHFTSHDNPYISETALEDLADDISELAYRQEILAQDVDEAPGALWKRDTLTKFREESIPDFAKVIVAIDPSATAAGDDAGIIGAGMRKLGSKRHFYCFEDHTIQGSPAVWAQKAIDLYYEIGADYIVAEKNNGGEMVSTVINQIDPDIRVRLVWASRGKQTRAEPVSTMFEKGYGHIVGNLYALEDELCLWVPGDPSPNRLDAMVWAATDLVLQYREAGTFGRNPRSK
jgi:phage terminase large subunit-like protein